MKNSERTAELKSSSMSMASAFFGVIASLGSIFLWIVFLFVNPYSDAGISGVTYGIAFAMLSLAVLGIVASLKSRAYLMYLVFLGSLPAGLYFLLTPGVFRWFGLFCALYLVSAIVMTVDKVVRGLNQKAKQI